MARKRGNIEAPWEALERDARDCRLPGKQLREPGEPRKSPYVDCSGCSDVDVYATDSPEGLDLLGLDHTDSRSDGVIWFKASEAGILVFVELKCGNYDNADRQLESTLVAWKAKAGPACGCAIHAVVILTGAAPGDLATRVKRFRKRVGVSLKVMAGRRAKTRRQSPNSRRVLCKELLNFVVE